MTGIYRDNIDFSKWWYKNDLTHVFIYSEKTFEWIKKEFGFENMFIEKNFIKFIQKLKTKEEKSPLILKEITQEFHL